MSTAAKIILAIIGVFVLLVVGCMGLLFMAHKTGSNVQEDFYEAVLAGDAGAVRNRFAPEVREKIDEPVMAAWMAAVKEHLGAFKGMSATKFSTSIKNENGKEVVDSTGTAEFEKGTAESKLRLVDGKIVAWSTESDALPDNWFTELEDASFYDARSQAFLKALFAGNADAARALASGSLREKLNGPDFRKMLAGIKAYYTPVTGVALARHAFDEGPPQQLLMRYIATGMPDVPGGEAPRELTIKWSFDGMQGVINGFNVPMSPK